jgi:YihY family inner membrane protein
MLGVLFSGPVLGVLREVADVLALESPIVSDLLWRLLTSLLSPGASFLAFLVMYRFLPNTSVRLRDVWLGALLASIAFEGVKWGFVYYVQNYIDYKVIYGSVGAVVALLTWVYLSAIIVLLGALVSSRYAAYASSFEQENQTLRQLWTGFSRVRLRVVESTATA